MSLPGFSAEEAIGPPTQSYRGTYVDRGLAQRAPILPDQLVGLVGSVEQFGADMGAEQVEGDLAVEELEGDLTVEQLEDDLMIEELEGDLAVEQLAADLGAEQVPVLGADVAVEPFGGSLSM